MRKEGENSKEEQRRWLLQLEIKRNETKRGKRS
jgi:hypothetical protein